ncbi:MAG: hypothetical protein ACRC8A_12390 [Microcoleaceae cyanobacterium]
MDVAELKFLLNLLNKPNYRAAITEIKLDPKTSALERDRICRELRDHRLIDCVEDVLKIKIAPGGESLLRLDPIGVPMAPQELKALKVCHEKEQEIAPKQAGLSESEREWVIPSLIKRGWIEATKKRIQDVWLTEKGKYYLAEEYLPSGSGNLSLTTTQIADYLQFLRAYFSPQTSNTLPGSISS